MDDYGFLSIVPPILTIIVALYSKNVLVALIVGILSGAREVGKLLLPIAKRVGAHDASILEGVDHSTIP